MAQASRTEGMGLAQAGLGVLATVLLVTAEWRFAHDPLSPGFTALDLLFAAGLACLSGAMLCLRAGRQGLAVRRPWAAGEAFVILGALTASIAGALASLDGVFDMLWAVWAFGKLAAIAGLVLLGVALLRQPGIQALALAPALVVVAVLADFSRFDDEEASEVLDFIDVAWALLWGGFHVLAGVALPRLVAKAARAAPS